MTALGDGRILEGNEIFMGASTFDQADWAVVNQPGQDLVDRCLAYRIGTQLGMLMRHHNAPSTDPAMGLAVGLTPDELYRASRSQCECLPAHGAVTAVASVSRALALPHAAQGNENSACALGLDSLYRPVNPRHQGAGTQ